MVALGKVAPHLAQKGRLLLAPAALRHTFATKSFRQGKCLKVIQSLLGHSSITQTMDTYSHLLEDLRGDAVGGLDEAFE